MPNLKAILAALDNAKHLSLMVVGDIMLDQYIRGKVDRISPEAPIPVVDVATVEYNLGGMGNVLSNVAGLECRAVPIGVIGRDSEGDLICNLLQQMNIDASTLIVDEHRCTTHKTRVMSQHHHLLRIDKENRSNLDARIEQQIIKRIQDSITTVDGVIIQDYNKGVLTASTINAIKKCCKDNHKPYFVDPKNFNFWEYEEATVFKPNLKEVCNALGRMVETESELNAAAGVIASRLNIDKLLITRGEHGLSLWHHGERKDIPSQARKVYDVSGAGDTVISALATLMVAGLDFYDAALAANIAAGIVVELPGVVAITKAHLLEVLNNGGNL